MEFAALPFRSKLADYQRQAVDLRAGWLANDNDAVRMLHHNHPRFMDETVPWLPKDLSNEEIRKVPIELEDTQLAIAHWYSFQNWQRLAEWVEAVAQDDSPVARFEVAVEAVIHGDSNLLRNSLRQHPDLVRARSTIVTHHDPPVHGATLLHYTAANGIEGYRQLSPPNAVEVAKILLDAGAEPDALAGMYGGQCTTMSMLVSSAPPANAGVQVPLVETLLEYGASVDARGSGDWTSPLMTALAFGFGDAAATLVRRGARVDNIASAAGLGLLAAAQQLLPTSTPLDRHRAMALSAQHGHLEIVRLLLDAGEDPSRYNPRGNHGHSTPLHQAVWSGHDQVVRLLVERGARLDIQDKIYQGTPLGWAKYGGKTSIAEYLRGQMAKRC
jgi:ankyrin repeat protein